MIWPDNSIPVTNTSVNPARSTGPALIVGGWALHQLWLFWLAPLAGAVLAGWTYRAVFEGKHPEPSITGRSESDTQYTRGPVGGRIQQ